MYVDVRLTEVPDHTGRIIMVCPEVHIGVDLHDRYDSLDIDALREAQIKIEHILRADLNRAISVQEVVQ